MPDPEGLVKALKPELNKIFKPAFLGRLVIIPYYPIRDEAMKKIIALKLGKIQRRLLETHRMELTYDDALLEEVGAPLHGSGKRRAQRGQYPDQHAAAGAVQDVAQEYGGRRGVGPDPRQRGRGRIILVFRQPGGERRSRQLTPRS